MKDSPSRMVYYYLQLIIFLLSIFRYLEISCHVYKGEGDWVFTVMDYMIFVQYDEQICAYHWSKKETTVCTATISTIV